MYLKYIQIVNFKNLKNVRFEFGKGANTVIGENDAGKSNAMTAMRILLDDEYIYNIKRLKETDFSEGLGEWRGHWIIISAFFDQISADEELREVCNHIIPTSENEDFLKSYIRCEDSNYGVFTLFIRPNKTIRRKLHNAKDKEEFNQIRNNITLLDYEFCYTSRSQADFTDKDTYNRIVGDLDNCNCSDPDEDDAYILGGNVDVIDIWKYISIEFIDALRDVRTELKKNNSSLRRVFDVVYSDIDGSTIDSIKEKVRDLNQSLASINEIQNIGEKVNDKLTEIVGLIYSPEICIESHIREEIESIARNLTIVPSNEKDIEQLGLGHLNILYIALKLVEFEAGHKHELLNIMIVEEPEAHVHTHIQRTLFDNLNVKNQYTQVIMTTHSTHISEVSNISKMNVLKRNGCETRVMRPTVGLIEYSKSELETEDLSVEKCIERYLDAKRSVLLFSKAVVLVEGDGEEILIPNLFKMCFGVSLDELGIGLINVGSVAFEYIASIFAEERIQRRCAIITDLDANVVGASKVKANAETLGKSRKDKLERLYSKNKWVKAFYAPHTLEIDFYDIPENRVYLERIIAIHYKQEATIKVHCNNLNKSEADRYDSVVTVVGNIRKGWHAILLSEKIDENVKIPPYILEAVVFAAKDVMTPSILKRMALYALNKYEDSERDVIYKLEKDEDIISSLEKIFARYEYDNFSVLFDFWKDLNSYG